MDAEGPPPPSEDRAPELRLYLLGGFRAEHCAVSIPRAAWPRAMAQTLVKVLAVQHDHRLHREQLEDLLWPDAPFAGAGPQLNKMVHMARHALEPELRDGKDSSYLHATRDVVALDRRNVWIDADHFEQASISALSGDVPQLEATLSLYSGVLLPEDRYADWAAARRETLAALHRRLLLALAAALQAEGVYAQAEHRLQMLLELDQADEEVHRRLIRLYSRDGRRHLALRQYRACCQVLSAQFGVEPEAETQSLYKDILTRTSSVPAAGPFPDRPPLPAPVRRIAERGSLVGREGALKLLALARDRAAGGSGALVLLAGEAGVGKSRLVAELARDSFQQKMAVLWGANYEQESALPYGPFAEAFGDYLSSIAAQDRQRLQESYPDLARLVPTLETAPGEIDRAPENHGRLFAAVVHALDELADRHALLIAIEDLHAAGEETLQLLHHLARLAPDRRWLLVATYREEDVRPGSTLQRFSAAVTRERLCRRLDLGRLARQACEDLVRGLLPGGSVDPTLSAYVYGLSLGNPLFAEQLIRMLERNETLALTGGHWRRVTTDDEGIPAQVQALIVERVGGMAATTRQILALAATAGMESAFSILSPAAERAFGPLTPGQILDALDGALEAHILEEQGDGYVFRHPLMRETLYRRLSHQRRVYLHAVLAQTIEVECPDNVAALAHHHLQANYVAGAIPYLERAGDRAAALHANESAEQHYRTLLSLLDEKGWQTEAALIREKLAGVLATLSRHDDAIAALEAAEQVYRAQGDGAAVQRVVSGIARMHGQRARPQEGIARIQAVLTDIDEESYPGGAASLHSTLGWLIFSTGGRSEVLPAARRAADLAARTDDTRLRAETLTGLARALLDVGDHDQGWKLMREAIELAEAHDHVYELATALVHTGIYASAIGPHLREAQRAFERALALADRVGDADGAGFVLGGLGHILFDLGDWDGARARLDRGVALARSVGATYHSAYPLAHRAQLASGEGNDKLCYQLSNDAVAIARRNGNADLLTFVAITLADLELQQGAPDKALMHLRDAGYPCREEAAAHVLQGEFARAEAITGSLVCETERREQRISRVKALWVHAMALAGQKRWGEARTAFEEAIGGADDVPLPYEGARARLAYGHALFARGQVSAGRAHVERALAVAARLGAAGYVRRAEGELALHPL